MIWIFLNLSVLWASAHSANGQDAEAEVEDTICAYDPHKQLQRRATDDSGNATDVGVGVNVGKDCLEVCM